MGRAKGANLICSAAFEAAGTPGTVPVSGFYKVPLVSHGLGEEAPLMDEELLGLGREPLDPIPDVKTNAGDIVVPVDVRNFGMWLKLFLGAPTTTGTGQRTHVFASGLLALPSMSIEMNSPEVTNGATVNYGARGNSFQIGLARSGKLNASCNLICIGETDPGASAAGTPTARAVQRFVQATGAITKDGSALGSVVAAELSFSNQLEAVESIKADGRIEDSDPGMVMLGGKLTVLYKDNTLLAAATSNPPTPIALTFGWTSGANSLLFSLPRVFLPKPKRPVSGPKGIQAEYVFKASGANAASLTATLVNDVTGY